MIVRRVGSNISFLLHPDRSDETFGDRVGSSVDQVQEKPAKNSIFLLLSTPRIQSVAGRALRVAQVLTLILLIFTAMGILTSSYTTLNIVQWVLGDAHASHPQLLDLRTCWLSNNSSAAASIISSLANTSTEQRIMNADISGWKNLHTRAGSCILNSNSWSMQCWPSFLIIGAMKAGTGELMKWLNTHPLLHCGASKHSSERELHFFSSLNHQLKHSHNLTMGKSKSKLNNRRSTNTTLLRYYLKNFPALPLLTSRVNHADQRITFEKSPDYMRDPRALDAIHRLLPGIKLIALLRNPVHRAISEFNHHCRHRRYLQLVRVNNINNIINDGKSNESMIISGIAYPVGSIVFAGGTKHSLVPSRMERSSSQFALSSDDAVVALKRSDSVLRKGEGGVVWRRLDYPCTAQHLQRYFYQNHLLAETERSVHQGMDYALYPQEVRNGFYAEQLLKIYDRFDRHQVLVLLQEDMFRNTFRTLREVESFLQIPCFNYATVALLAGKVECTESSCHNSTTPTQGSQQIPPLRWPSSSFEQLKLLLKSWRHLRTIRVSNGSGRPAYGTAQLLHDSRVEFREWLQRIFLQPNAALVALQNDVEPFSKKHLTARGWKI